MPILLPQIVLVIVKACRDTQNSKTFGQLLGELPTVSGWLKLPFRWVQRVFGKPSFPQIGGRSISIGAWGFTGKAFPGLPFFRAPAFRFKIPRRGFFGDPTFPVCWGFLSQIQRGG